MTQQRPLVAFPRLLVLDREASAKFYEGLGFVRVASDATFVHVRWGESGDLFLVSVPTGVNVGGRRGWGVLLCFITLQLDELSRRAEALGAVVQGPELQPWHTREVVVVDPDGYRLAFVAPGESAVAPVDPPSA
jgi:catechol 2,3-dioxygenase-like lactoylglutathione lyase family enzyme